MSGGAAAGAGRAIVHVDMDAFYASVEVLDDPSLAGRPVIVGGSPESRGVVSAASYEARRYGVHSAMSAARARRLCPRGVFLEPRMDRYVEVSRRIRAIFHDYTPLVEPLSLDEAFLDVTGSRRLFGPAEAIGREIKRRIRDEVGLVASVGVAPNKFLAKLASDLDKPDGFVVIRPGAVQAVLDPLPVGRLWGVGEKTRAVLERAGVRTVADLRRRGAAIEAAVGASLAVHLLRLARGVDERPVVPDHEARSIGAETTFPVDVADAGALRARVDELAARVGRRVRRAGVRAQTVHLKARYADFTTVTRSATLPAPTDRTVTIRDAARELLERRLDRRERALRLLGVSVSNLVRAEAEQVDLFADAAPARHARLDRVIDALEDRFGPGVVRRGAPRGAGAGRPGAGGHGSGGGSSGASSSASSASTADDAAS